MKPASLLLSLFASGACAFTPPVVTLPMPAPALTIAAGQTLTLKWTAPTEDTSGKPLPADQALTFNVWEVQSGTPVLLQSGLTTPTRVHAGMRAGTYCYVATATLAQAPGVTPTTVDSVGSSPPFCVAVTAVAITPAPPTNGSGS